MKTNMKLRVFIASGVLLLSMIAASRINLTPNALSIEVVSPKFEDTYQLFYDIGRGFNETDSLRAGIQPSNKTATVTFFGVSFLQIQTFRIDPGSRAGLIQIKSIQVQHEFHKLRLRIPLYEWTDEQFIIEFGSSGHISDFKVTDRMLQITSTGMTLNFSTQGIGMFYLELSRRNL